MEYARITMFWKVRHGIISHQIRPNGSRTRRIVKTPFENEKGQSFEK
jgi:hypothetical protein